MCGLSAVVSFEPHVEVITSLLAMHGQIQHRGPDGEGFAAITGDWNIQRASTLDGLRAQAPQSLRLALAFRWLKIQDLDDQACQPMVSSDKRFWLMFNGEIYNFSPLREELGQLGHRFKTIGDTEVVLKAFAQWGVEAFRRLNGMWAIIIYDAQKKELTISRDRFGIKPLFYCWTEHQLLIGSEVKQILSADDEASANRLAVARFAHGQRPETAEETFFDSIFAQPAGTYAQINLDRPPTALNFCPYWQLQERPDTVGNIDDRSRALESLLALTVKEHTFAQVPVGLLLSGGLDSSLVAALARPNSQNTDFETYSMIPADAAPEFDETRYVDSVAKYLQMANFKAEFSPTWLKSNMARITRTQEAPVSGMAVAAQFFTFELAAKHGRRVVLDGQGSDELFAGYPRHQYVYLRDCLRKGDTMICASELGQLALHDSQFFGDIWRNIVTPRLSRMLGIRAEANSLAPLPKSTPKLETLQTNDLSSTLRKDVLGGNLKAVLAVTDRNSMAHSIEARVPFIDQRVADFAFALPDAMKLGNGKRKRILRVIARRLIPHSVVDRVDRIGFGVPAESWLRNYFQSELRKLHASPIFSEAQLISRNSITSLVRDFLSGDGRATGLIWRLYAIEQWARAYAVTGL